MNRNLVGSICIYGRFCIKYPQSRMKGEQHRLGPQPQVNFHKLFVRNRLGKLTCLKPWEISIMLISLKNLLL